MTERSYELAPLGASHDGKFTARVVRAEKRAHSSGATLAVVLDRTLFYPEGGGQPSDLGTLGGHRVLHVGEEGEDVIHFLDDDGGAISAGSEIAGQVDVARRRDHMEQHSGQHLLSAILLKKHRIPTVSFHLGADVSTIDVSSEDAASALVAAESEANRVIRANVPVGASVFRGDAAQDEAKKLRKAPEAEALASSRGLRVVAIGAQGEIDRDACCGTHVGATGELGALVVLGAERGKKGTSRVHFVVGARAVRALRDRLRALDETAAALTTGFADLPTRARKLLDDAKALRKERDQARERAIGFEAAELARSAPTPRIARLLEDGDAQDARAFALAVTRARPDAVVVVVHKGEKATAVVGRGESASAIDAAKVLREALTPLGGKGGGSATFAQGAAPDASKAKDLLATLERALG